MAKSADLNIDEDLQNEILDKAGKRMKNLRDELEDFKVDEDGAKHKKK
eukprot:CAMPEP_0202970328 /NCGR_PEP_ID=MMETSP1396-20130829/16287_1 /ASSEMBLY_ACC=CAM_ASM_000872 /TAXON_ID= /ORGANISM="Pseudokeronopsis sp., Strain Brazil" /LENGTH=47 /DNA_ID= /DNA_START= /DNA_END= /DNA_ORIENTATION=